MTRRLLALSTVLALSGGAAACGNNNTTTPTPTTPTTFTEVFSGTITVNGASSHAFIAQASGTVTLTLSTLTPDAANPIGIALGTWTGAACQLVIANDKAVQGSSVAGAVGGSGALCARAYDVGNVAAGTPISYEFTVLHP